MPKLCARYWFPLAPMLPSFPVACLCGNVRNTPAVLWGLKPDVVYPVSCSRYLGERLLLPGGARKLRSDWRCGAPQLRAAVAALGYLEVSISAAARCSKIPVPTVEVPRASPC